MKTFIYEMGVIDKIGNKHPVYFKEGLNVVTGKSSTGKSALIEIFDYCFGSDEYTVPKGVITDSAALYYLFIKIDGQNMVIARRPDINNKAFFRREESYSADTINANYFDKNLYIDIESYKKFITGFFWIWMMLMSPYRLSLTGNLIVRPLLHLFEVLPHLCCNIKTL